MAKRTLLLLRHGKAEGFSQDGDKLRELTNRGIHDASTVGKLIEGEFKSVDLVVASDATRASQTARIASDEFHYAGAIDFKPEIYEATVNTLLHIVHHLPDNAHTVVIVGHNPGFEELCSDLAGRQIGLPTCGLVALSIKGDWNEAEFGKAEIIGIWSPNSQN